MTDTREDRFAVRWISPTERLPETNEVVLIFRPNYMHKGYTRFLGIDMAIFVKHDKWFLYNEKIKGKLIQHKLISNWMSLPENPLGY